MTIDTRYNINDYLWFIYKGKPRWEQVKGISIRPKTRIFYHFQSGLVEVTKMEHEVFSTKEALLKSLYYENRHKIQHWR
jgi:hypothetical protein